MKIKKWKRDAFLFLLFLSPSWIEKWWRERWIKPTTFWLLISNPSSLYIIVIETED
jgi:hypothetical protein